MKTLLLLLLANVAPAATFFVTATGLGGEPDYEQRFSMWAKDIEKLIGDNGQVITVEKATKPALTAALDKVTRGATAEDALVLTLIGHGTFDGLDYKFNLVGPDVTASELATLLDRFPGRQLVVNLTSASGGGLEVLRKQNRVVITATKSGTEKNATVFGRYWVEALRDPAADTDKNGTVSALEAFRYADQRTVRFFETQKRLATEHALLEDTGKGEGVRAPSADNGQGLLAARFALLRFDGPVSELGPEKRELLAAKERIEGQIEKLKYEKAAMPTQEYRKQLGVLLLELAKTQEELDK